MLFQKGWYVAYTRPQHEKKVTSQLQEKKISFFSPTRKIMRQWHDRNKMVEVPLFPSYIFVYLNKVEEYYQSIESQSVLGFIRFGKEVARVRDCIVDNLRFILETCGDAEVSPQRFAAGEMVMIKMGPLAGLHCEVVEYNNEKKIVVRLELLNRTVMANLTASYLEP
jgi:transcriptional antiterminator RfaH